MRNLLVIMFSVAAINSTFAQEGYAVGAEAIDFKLMNAVNTINGIDAEVSLEDYNNAKGYIIVFTCNHCPFSVAYEDRLIALHRKYALKGYPVVAINPNDPLYEPADSYDNMKIRAKEKNFPFAYLYDETQEIAAAYGATHTPQVFVLQKKKDKNIVRYIGAIDNNSFEEESVSVKYLEDALDSLLAGDLPKRKMTKSIGCTIKWDKTRIEMEADRMPVTKKN